MWIITLFNEINLERVTEIQELLLGQPLFFQILSAIVSQCILQYTLYYLSPANSRVQKGLKKKTWSRQSKMQFNSTSEAINPNEILRLESEYWFSAVLLQKLGFSELPYLFEKMVFSSGYC